MRILSNIKLVPVINFHPHYMMEEDNPSIYTSPSTKEERYHLWKNMMLTFGLERLKPVRVGMEMVNLMEIDEHSLGVMLQLYFEHQCGETDIKKAYKQVNKYSSFYGGVILYEAEELLISPQCCVCLSDYNEWKGLEPSKNFKRIWVGHPWIYYKTEGDNILLTEYIEKDFSNKWKHHHPEKDNLLSGNCTPINREDIDDSFLRFSINQKHFDTAVEKMIADIAVFKQRMINVLKRLGYKKPNRIANAFFNEYSDSYNQEDADDEHEIEL